MFLYEEINALKKFGLKKDIPDFIEANLSSNIKLRDYQKEALEYTLLYFDSEISKNKQTHLLYHMATGSGKTVIMAMMILYYYSKGYRNFVFFTNQTNIVSKTKINFLEKASSKFLFSSNILIDGKSIEINEVKNFECCNPNAINICFNTVQGIHSGLTLVKEGAITIDDFENDKVVLIADEAHHLNSTTSRDTEENEDNATWEDTINNIFQANKDNVLLEFTATCDLQDQNVLHKYQNKMIYNFDLKEFRKAGYTKEFANLTSDVDPFTRALQAVILSEYRKLMFAKYKINKLPVVLLKSKTISASCNFYDEFHQKLKDLKPEMLQSIRDLNANNNYFKDAFFLFDELNLTNEKLVELFKIDFSEDNSINMNELTPETELIVNSLDEPNNHYRIIFTVDKLTEGWDVLSLFDIVRLYETRQPGHGGAISKYTISEAQLIGRGARYCPFKFENEQIADKRKYSDYSTPESICETLLYHCMHEARYIDELNKALKAIGLTPDNDPIKVEYILKDGFKKSRTYQEGFVYLNDRVEVSRNSVTSLPMAIRTKGVSYKCINKSQTFILLTEEKAKINTENTDSIVIKFHEIQYSILYKAFRCYSKVLNFMALIKQFPHLKTIKQFLTDSDYLGDFPITFIKDVNYSISNNDLLEGVKKALEFISEYVSKIETTYQGTTNFKPYLIRKSFTNRTRNYLKDTGDLSWGNGVSQASGLVDENYRIDLSSKEWYAYNDNFGTSEEKKFVKYFETIVNDLKKDYDEVYLIRNEIQISIYDFNDGSKFEPDYLLVLQKSTIDKPKTVNMFIEPKGEHLLEKDSWKNKLMLELHERAIPIKKYVDDDDYLIWGTPLYNENNTKDDFVEFIKNALDEIIQNMK